MGTRDETMRAFAKRLQNALDEKGWRQSDLARRAFGNSPDGGAKGRDLVCNWVGAKALPTSGHLKRICDVLGAERKDLLPEDTYPADKFRPAPLKMEVLGDGKVLIEIRQELPAKTAFKIAEMVNKCVEF